MCVTNDSGLYDMLFITIFHSLLRRTCAIYHAMVIEIVIHVRRQRRCLSETTSINHCGKSKPTTNFSVGTYFNVSTHVHNVSI